VRRRRGRRQRGRGRQREHARADRDAHAVRDRDGHADGRGRAPVAEAAGSADGGRFIFRITELKRSGPTVVLNASVSLAGGSPRDSIQLNDTFSDGVFVNIKGGDAQEQGDVFDGVALIDPEARKKYLVARQADGRCVCSNELGGEFVEEDAPVSLQATLAAPPESVTKVNVVVPNVKTFIDVPIS
jgi:hypothetical protein